MADQFQIGGGNWWDSSARNRFDTGSSPSSTALNSTGSFGWSSEIVDTKPRSSIDSGSVSGTSNVFQDPQKLQGPDSSLQMIGLSLPSQAMDWNQALLRAGKTESSFSSVLQEDLNSSRNYQQESGIGSSQEQWRQKMYSGSHEDSSVSEFKQRGGFSLEQPQQFSSHISSSESSVTCQALTSSYQMDSAVYGSPSTMLQGFLGSDNQPAELSAFENRSMNFPYPPNYAMNSGELLPNSWSKFPQFMRNSPSKHTPHSQLQFSNNATYWNASAAATNDVRSSLFHPLQPQFPMQSFDEKMKNTSEVRDSGMVVKKSSNEPSSKRPRSETPSTLPAFKVRKEKMGDRITALQQLVSPFGKTDTASVLSEAIEYIKFLHEQVSVLSTPYLKSGAPIQHQQNSDKSKDPEGPKQDLKSRGLCLVPVSSTYPVTNETTVDFWTPTFGGTFR